MDIRIQHFNDDVDPFPVFDAIFAMGPAREWEVIDASSVRRKHEMTWRSRGHGKADLMRTRVILAADRPEIVDLAIDQLLQGISTDGAHHKNYRIDQALRVLLGDRYDEIRESWAHRYGYDEGIAP